MDGGTLGSRCCRRDCDGGVWEGCGFGLAQLHKRGNPLAGIWAGRERAKHCSPHGGSTARGSPGDPPHPHCRSPHPRCPRGRRRSDLARVGHSWGHPVPTHSPGLVSKPLSDVCRPGSFSADFLSHGLSALGAPAGAGARGGTAPRATQRPLSVTQRPPRVTQRAAHGFTLFRGAKPW